jgi:hypothetical protein
MEGAMDKRKEEKMKKLVVLMVCLGLLGFMGPAQATPITYTVESTGSGTIGTQSFSNAHIIVSFSGDTANVIKKTIDYFSNEVGTGTVSITGIGTATFTSGAFAFVNQTTDTAGISQLPTGTILGTEAISLATYDLKSAIGPITGETTYYSTYTYDTSLGNLNFTAMDSSSTFTATPLPASVFLLGSGLLGLGGWRWRQRR